MSADVPEALADLARAFRAARVRWYVFGAQAVIAAGVPRLTADIDVTVEVPAGGPSELVAALGGHRFTVREVGDVATFIAEARVIPMLHTPSGIPVDVVLAGPGLEEEMIARARKRRVGGVEIPFVAIDDLIALKLLAGRDKDLEDVRSLVRAAPADLSLEVARERVATLGAILDDATLIATFDRLVERAPARKAPAKPRAPKRPGPKRR